MPDAQAVQLDSQSIVPAPERMPAAVKRGVSNYFIGDRINITGRRKDDASATVLFPS